MIIKIMTDYKQSSKNLSFRYPQKQERSNVIKKEPNF